MKKIRLLNHSILFLFFLTFFLSASEINDQNLPAKGQLISVPNYRSNTKINSAQFDTTEVYSENFESGGSSWSVSGSWQIGNPTSGPASGYNSTNCAGTNLSGSYNNSADDWLISPSVNLPTLRGAKEKLIVHFYEWYAIESAYDYGRVKISNDNGTTWTEIENRSGSSDWRKTEFDISSYAGQSIKIAFNLTTDGSVTYDGWFVDDFEIDKINQPPLSVNINNLNPANFPFIYLNVAVDTFGTGISSLSADQFEVDENTVRQTDYFEVTPPEESGGARLSDIVFVLDVTGSMSDEIDSVKANMENFVDSLAASDIDYGIGFVVFGDVTYTYNDGNFYYDKETILSIIENIQIGENGIGNGGDTPENQLQGMADGALFNYRPGAQKVEIMITDAYAHENDDVTSWTVPNLIDLLTSNDISVYPVFDTGDSYQNNQYIPIADATNTDGDYYYIYDNFNGIINDISQTISNTYVIRYKSSEPVFDGVKRHVEVKVTYEGNIASDTASYIPGSSPDIQRTAETIELHNQSWAEGTEFDIKAEITDAVEPFVQNATLYYRTSGESNYKSLSMTVLSGNIYHAVIPGSDVVTPGLEYYLTATDGQSTSSDPSVDPTSNPYVLGILPNQAPVIVHVPVDYGVIDENVVIDAQITDNTNMLTNTILFYRKTGQLIYNQLEMTDMGSNNFQATIPREYMTEDGVDYYIKAYDDFNVSATHGTFDHPHQILAEFLLHRISGDTTEYFTINKHSWRFGNTQNKMWPKDWWSQFDYSASEYPLGWASFSSERFPDWPLFVDAFGKDQCYLNYSPNLLIYNPIAVNKWWWISNPTLNTEVFPPQWEYWKGSCFGFAISSFLSFDDKTSFLNAFPGVEDFTELYNLNINDNRRKCINQLWIYQFGDEQSDYMDEHRDDTPLQTLEQLKDMLKNESQNHRILVFFNQNGSGGHAVNPIKVYRDKDNPDIEKIMVYDNNWPGIQNLTISVNLKTQEWSYPWVGKSGWKGKKGLFLMDPVKNYLNTPVLSFSSRHEPIVLHKDNSLNKIRIYNSPNATINITNSFNQSIGYSDSVAFNNFSEGIPIIPITGKFQPPIGYYLPIDDYRITMNNFSDSSNYFAITLDTINYQYTRLGATNEQRDIFSISDRFKIINPDPIQKNISIETILSSGNKYKTFKLENLRMSQNDSAYFKEVENEALKTVNMGNQKEYDLSVEIVKDSTKLIFEHYNISISKSSSHIIFPKWENIDTEPVTIYIDNGNDGTIDDSIKVDNQYTGIQFGNNLRDKIPDTYFLTQNYPNPFNNSTRIQFGLPKSGIVKLELFNINGQKIKTLLEQNMSKGVHVFKFNGDKLASGLYFYRLSTKGYTSIKKMILLK